MASLSNITGKQLITFVTTIGYKLNRQNGGSHRIYTHISRVPITIPAYKKKIVKLGLLCGILKNIGISKKEFISSIS